LQIVEASSGTFRSRNVKMLCVQQLRRISQFG